MTPALRAALASVAERSVVIGSCGLAIHCPKALRGPPPDADVLIARRDLGWACDRLRSAGFGLESWGEPFVELPEVRGRMYLRAHRRGVVLDLTYEGPIACDEAMSRSLRMDGLNIGALADICRLMLKRGTAKDLARVRLAMRSTPPLTPA